MTLPTLFGKLQEHEMELSRLHQNEDVDKKKKGLALKASSSHNDDDDDEDELEDLEMNEETFNLLVRRFGKFLKKKGSGRRPAFPPKKNLMKGENSTPTPPTCFGCGKPGHMKMDCPLNQRKGEKFEKRPNKEKKGRRAYIAWDENDMDSSDESEDEVANLCLMAKDDLDEEVDSQTLESQPSYEELQDAFEELHEESLRLAKMVSSLKKTNSSFENQIDSLNKQLEELKLENETLGLIDANSSCFTCSTHKDTPSSSSACHSCLALEKEVEDLKNTLAKFTLGRENLNILLGKQRCVFEKAGLGYNPNKQ